MLCEICESIKKQPHRDPSSDRTELRGIPRQPIGRDIIPLVCIDCGTEWSRVFDYSTDEITWTLLREGEE